VDTGRKSSEFTEAAMKNMWIRNSMLNRAAIGHWHDASEYVAPQLVKRIIILGTGPTSRQYLLTQDEHQKGDIVVGNQSALVENKDIIDICVVSDAQDAVYRKINEISPQGWKMPAFMLASFVDHRIVMAIRKHHGTFYGFYNYPTDNDELAEELDRIKPKGITTCVAQVGSSMNAAIILMCALQFRHTLPKVPIKVYGVDYQYEDGSRSRSFEIYEEQLQWLLKELKDYKIERVKYEH
jgi:hypothetical protein